MTGTEDPEFAFSTWHDAAQRLNEAAWLEGVELHALPFRRFHPESDSTWWLVPSTGNPAYPFGKIVLEGPSPQSPDGPFVGLHVEKGVGPAAAEMFSKSAWGRRMLMDDGWTWRAFTRELGTGAVDRQLAVAVDAAGDLPVHVAVVTQVQGLPNLEAGDQRPIGSDAEHAWFRVSNQGLSRVGQHNPGDLVRRLTDVETMSSLAEKISALPDFEWRWVEIMIGFPFRRVAEGGLSPLEIWRRACAPWRPWLR